MAHWLVRKGFIIVVTKNQSFILLSRRTPKKGRGCHVEWPPGHDHVCDLQGETWTKCREQGTFED